MQLTAGDHMGKVLKQEHHHLLQGHHKAVWQLERMQEEMATFKQLIMLQIDIYIP